QINKAKYDHVRVEKILSTDTIVLEDGEKVKLIGLKAPSAPRRKPIKYDKNGFVVDPEETNPVTSVEQQAFDFVKSLLEGKYVRLEFDEQKSNENLRTLAYVYLTD